ncbi:MAG: cytochrome b/b6 domain-containing protein [Thermoleophilia bacterium]
MPDPARLHRFDRRERLLHWTHAGAVLVLLASGFALYQPDLAELIGRRPLVRDVHVDTALAWGAALLAQALLGGRALRDRLRELGDPAAPRFNRGQKTHATIQAALAVLVSLTGALIWLGERHTGLRVGGAVALHDVLALATLALLLGHLYLAVLHPATRHALRGMTRGEVDAAWAREQHPAWAAEDLGESGERGSGEADRGPARPYDDRMVAS